MLTWVLWRKLLYPAVHPLFRRTIRTPVANMTTPYMTWAMSLTGVFACCGLWVLFVQIRSGFAVLALLATVFFTSSFYVVAWVIGTSAAIAREHERRVYDQLCLPPSGALGANLAICSATLHRTDLLGWSNLLRKLVTGSLLLIFLMILLTTLLTQNSPNLAQFVLLLFNITALAAASYLDHVQSIVLGGLVGMLAPTYAPRRFEARVVAIGLFLALQAAAYSATWLAGFALPGTIYPTLNLQGWFWELTLVVLRLVIFYGLREGVIFVVWRVLTARLNADPRGRDLGARHAV